jgi:protein O-mannosyl-transferase
MARARSSLAVDSNILMLVAVLIATAIVYLRCLSGGFVSDDKPLIVFNPAIGQWSFIWKSLTRNEYWFSDPTNKAPAARYRPLMLVWLGLNYHLFGLNPAGWHAAGVMLHLLGVWLVFRIASRLAGRAEAGLFAALLFGLLPGHAEAVAWTASIGVPLSAVLTLAAFLLYLLGASGDRRSRILAPICFAAAMLSHELAVALPGLIALHSFLFEPAPAPPDSLYARVRRAIVSITPFLAILPLYFAARAYALGSLLSANRFPPNRATSAQVVMTIPSVVTAYLSGIVMPLARFYHHRVLFVSSPASPHFYLPLAALIALAGTLLLAIKNHPRRRLYLFCAGWTLIALVPLLDLFALPEDALVPDGYAYLASFGWCLFAGDWLTAPGGLTPVLRCAGRAAGLALAAAYALALWKTQLTFHDDFTLFTRCVASFPESYHCHDQLASLLRERGDLAGAESEFEAALRYHPPEPSMLYEKGILDARLGRTRQAERELQTALGMLQQAGPPPATGYVTLAELYDADGDQVRAEAALDYARSLPGGASAVQIARARMKMRHGDPAGAEKILQQAASDYPGDYQVWTMLGLLMSDEKRYQEAYEAFARAVSLAPGDVRSHVFAARALHMLARDQEALAQCRQALATDPGNVEARQLSDEIAAAPPPN